MLLGIIYVSIKSKIPVRSRIIVCEMRVPENDTRTRPRSLQLMAERVAREWEDKKEWCPRAILGETIVMYMPFGFKKVPL